MMFAVSFFAVIFTPIVTAGVSLGLPDIKKTEPEMTEPEKDKKLKATPSSKVIISSSDREFRQSTDLLEDNSESLEANPKPETEIKSKKSNNHDVIQKTRTVVNNKEKPQFVEGYKITNGSNGKKKTTYVHGEVEKTSTGISGYLYDPEGKKTYVYGVGTSNNEDDAGIHAKDNESSDYILDSR